MQFIDIVLNAFVLGSVAYVGTAFVTGFAKFVKSQQVQAQAAEASLPAEEVAIPPVVVEVEVPAVSDPWESPSAPVLSRQPIEQAWSQIRPQLLLPPAKPVYESMTVRELHEVARGKVKGFRQMNKARLLDALRRVG